MNKQGREICLAFIVGGNIMSAALIIDGVEIPFKYDGYKLGKEKIWSTNTGRNNNGDMVGTIIALKRKIEGTLVPIEPRIAAILDEKLASKTEFMECQYLDVDGIMKPLIGYISNVEYPFLGTNLDGHGRTLIRDVRVAVIEK